jgi:hypothetical protein
MDYIHLCEVSLLDLLRSSAQQSLLQRLADILDLLRSADLRPLSSALLVNAAHSAQHRASGSDKLKRSTWKRLKTG